MRKLKAESRNRQQQENWHRSRSDLATHNHHHYHHHQTRTVDQLLPSIFAQFSALGGGGGGGVGCSDQKELTLNFAKKTQQQQKRYCSVFTEKHMA